MEKVNLKKAKKKGWKVGSVREFLDLTPEEMAFVNVKVNLSKYLLKKREQKKLTQSQFAQLINSSQSRVAKMEKANESVTVDLILRSLFALGTTKKEISEVFLKAS